MEETEDKDIIVDDFFIATNELEKAEKEQKEENK